MKKKLSGEALTEVMEKELRAMVREGYESSPITNKALHDRLKQKGIISGSISTLTSRKDVIEYYKKKQLDEVGGTFGQSARTGATQSRTELIKANAQLREQVEESKQQIKDNIDLVIAMINEIRATGIHRNIERVLSPFFLREVEKREFDKRYNENNPL